MSGALHAAAIAAAKTSGETDGRTGRRELEPAARRWWAAAWACSCEIIMVCVSDAGSTSLMPVNEDSRLPGLDEFRPQKMGEPQGRHLEAQG